MKRLNLTLISAWATAFLAWGSAQAVPLPADQEMARYKADGSWPQVAAHLQACQSYGSGKGIDEDAALALIEADYGLPTAKQGSFAKSGSLRVDFDSNGVIDERDVLGLGFTDLRDAAQGNRRSSTTLPYGTAAQNNRPKCLVLLIKFADQGPTDIKNQGYNGGSDVNHDAAWAYDKWFDLSDPASLPEMSVANYYKKASYGKLELGGDVFNNAAVCDADGWITSSYDYAELHNDTASYENVVEDAIAQIDPHINFANYDSNGDGYLDGLITIYAGPDNVAADPDLWYFRWWQSPGFNTGDTVKIGAGVWVSEEGWLYLYCHEFGHELGLPDLYDVGDELSGDPMPGCGYWTLMSHWYYPEMGEVPVQCDAWSRMHLGWVDPINIVTTDELGSFSLSRATSASPDNTVYRIWRNGLIGPEYFLTEYRDADHDIDAACPGTDGGLLIWHVNERRTSAVNHANAFNPQRLWLETADYNQPINANNPWRESYLGADDIDYFWDFSTPDAKDYNNAQTGVTIDPSSAAGGVSMTMDVENVTNATLPNLSWDSPAEGASVNGSVTIDVSSNATTEVRYFVNGCLKKVEAGSPYNGFTWDTLTALNGPCRLRAVAKSSGAGDLVRVIERSVTVANPQNSGKSLDFTDDFNGYNSDQDSALLALWNLYEDPMAALEIQWRTSPRSGASGGALAMCQSSFPAPPFNHNDNDANAGVYQGQDQDYLMSPRINLAGYSGLQLKYKVAFRGMGNGEVILQTQISDNDGQTWKDLEGLTENSMVGTQYDTGYWTDSDYQFVQRTLSLNSYIGKQVYVRFKFVGGVGYNPGFALDDFQITGVALVLNSVAPSRAKVGDLVTLTGSGFGATQGDGEVRFNNGSGGFVGQGTVTSWNNTQIVCSVPGGAASHATSGIWVFKSSAESNKKPFKVVLAPPNLGGLDQL